MPKSKKKQRLEKRLKRLEKRLLHLENWTGTVAFGDPTGNEVPVVDTLLAQEKIIRHLLQMLDFVGPNFTIRNFRTLIEKSDEAGADPISRNWDPEFAEGLKGVIERLIPDPLPRDRGHQKQPSRFRPVLVPKDADGDADKS